MKRQQIELIVCVVILVLIFGLSLCLRIALPANEVFGGTAIKLTDNDAYFYMRLMDNLCAHFPSLGNFDPYYIFPSGKDLAGQPLFFIYFMGFFAWLLGGGTPSQQTIDLVGVYFPAILGALMVFPVFLIARTLFNKWAGLAAALLITLIPGEFLVRTLLGNTDSHVMEIFFSTLFMMFLLLGAEKGKLLAFHTILDIRGNNIVIMLIYLLFAGLCLGIYIASWMGAALFILISFTWLVLQFISDHLRKADTFYLGLCGAVVYIFALILSLLVPNIMPITMAALVIALLSTIALSVLSLLFKRRGIKGSYYLLAIFGTGLLALALLALVNSSLIGMMLDKASAFIIWNPLSPIAETQPLLIQDGKFTLALVWGNYTVGSLLALAALVIVCYRAIKKGQAGILMIAVWSITILLSTLTMRRFAYYLAINIAILSGLSCWLILKSCGFKEMPVADQPAVISGKEVKKAVRKGKRKANVSSSSAVLMAVGVAIVLVLLVYPNTGPLPGGDKPFFDVATKALYTPSDAWCDSLKWLRDKSPEPFNESGYYYKTYESGNKKADYSVLTWWDYGYWITRIGHRVPVCNPGDSLKGEEKYFTAQSPEQTATMSANWKTKYVIIDSYMVNWQQGFKAIASSAGQQQSSYYEIYYRQQNEGLAQALLYYPEYYRTTAVHLYCFDGKKYIPQETAVISWEPQTGTNGRSYKLITGLKTFNSYDDASDFITLQKSGNWRIVGKDPMVSPVPLEALQGYTSAFNSSQKSKVGSSEIPAVKVFEYAIKAGQHEQ